MRLTRLLLVVLAAGATAGVAASGASALTFPDDLCPVASGTVIKVCPTGFSGKPYSLQLRGREGTGCVPYVTFKVSGTLPPGLSMTSSGLISGTPTQAGEWTFFVIMQDIPASQGGVFWCADDNSTEKQFSITIVQGLQIQQRQTQLTPGQLTVNYSLQFTAAGGGNPSWSVSGGALPPGLTLNSSGLLSGTPTSAGDYTFKITVAGGGSSDTQTYSMSVVPKLQITAPRGLAEVGLPFRLAPQATGGKPAYSWTVDATSALPAGLTLDAASGSITGTPTAAGSSTVRLTVTDALGLKTTADVPVTVVPRLLLLKKSLPKAAAGAAFRASLPKTGGARPFKWTLSGAPRGLRLNSGTGQLTGSPSKAGTYRLKITVRDSLGAISTRTYVLKVSG
jgi:large repetitive protein